MSFKLLIFLALGTIQAIPHKIYYNRFELQCVRIVSLILRSLSVLVVSVPTDVLLGMYL